MESDMSVQIIKHDLTAADAKAMEGMRATFASMPKLEFGPKSRGAFDDIMSRTPAPQDVQFEAGDVGGVPGWWCRPHRARTGEVILYLHGGGYVIGSAKAYRNLAGHIAKLAGVAAFVADYALAPERPFPAAFEDFQALHEGLVRLGYERIAVVGDSAGGGLALASVTGGVARSGRIVGVAAMSPWVDTTLSGASIATRAAQDPILSRETIEGTRALFLGEHGGDRRLDVLGADLSTLPPVRIDVGDAEVLLDDAVRFAEKADQAGVSGEVHIWDGMVHVFPSNIAMLEASAAALQGIGDFLTGVLHPPAAMKVLVLGATGGTGREIVRELKDRGHAPVALVRSPDKAQELGVPLVTGDARDPKVLDAALAGCDAVISALGTPVSPSRR